MTSRVALTWPQVRSPHGILLDAIDSFVLSPPKLLCCARLNNLSPDMNSAKLELPRHRPPTRLQRQQKRSKRNLKLAQDPGRRLSVHIPQEQVANCLENLWSMMEIGHIKK